MARPFSLPVATINCVGNSPFSFFFRVCLALGCCCTSFTFFFSVVQSIVLIFRLISLTLQLIEIKANNLYHLHRSLTPGYPRSKQIQPSKNNNRWTTKKFHRSNSIHNKNRNLPLFTAILPQFFSLFKNFNFPLRKNPSLSSLSLGTLYVYVFSSVLHVIWVAGRFSAFVLPKCRLLLGTVIPARAKGQ